MTVNSVTFSTLPIWVQVWGLPFGLINEEGGWEIGRGLGHVYEVDNKTFLSDQAGFIRIRVRISLVKPIHQGGWVANPEGDQGASQQAKKPYGDWLKAGFFQKDMGSEWAKTNAPPPTPAPESPQRARGSINTHDEVAGINDINGRKNNASTHKYLHQTQAADC
uniref:DUF4283 domain-containing protein n=1 Tax=Quercus lobata TaxID=97700 RepID=A0A7N2L582_QUELO